MSGTDNTTDTDDRRVRLSIDNHPRVGLNLLVGGTDLVGGDTGTSVVSLLSKQDKE